MPTIVHQRLVQFLLLTLSRYEGIHGGMVLTAPHPTTLQSDKVRQPDLVYKLSKNLPGPDEKYFRGADLVMEVVSGDSNSHKRDYETKVLDYAEAGIPEYWIVDPQKNLVTVLTLQAEKYVLHGEFTAGQIATSVLLSEYSVKVDELFAAAKS